MESIASEPGLTSEKKMQAWAGALSTGEKW